MSDEHWRNRIVETGVADTKTLMPNAKNYRRHPKGQIAALKGSLSEIGWIAPIVARRHSDAVGVQPTKGGANPTRPLLRMTKLP